MTSPVVPSGEPATETTFISSVYPYSWTLPTHGVTVRNWHAALRPWNGEEGIQSVAPFVDTNGFVDGSVFVLGTPWSGTLDSFVAAVNENVAHHHGCGAPTSSREIEVQGTPATAYAQVCSGVPVLRVAAVHDGYGLVIAEQVMPEKVAVAMDDLLTWLPGIAWQR